VEAILDLDRAREEAARRDRDRMQGVWKFVSGTREAQLLISGEHFTMRFRNGDIYVGTYTLNAHARPKAMDLTINEGPEQYRGKTALAIYEFDGDHLIWCPAEPGREDRLRAFPPEDDFGHLCIIFRREKNGNDAKG
jgi:uncharacterized protein (TIGR03067 family)